jgi:hypothetical protein
MRPNTRRIQAKWNQVRRDTRARGTTTDCSADAAVSTTIAEPATTAATRTPITVSRLQKRIDGGDHSAASLIWVSTLPDSGNGDAQFGVQSPVAFQKW